MRRNMITSEIKMKLLEEIKSYAYLFNNYSNNEDKRFVNLNF